MPGALVVDRAILEAFVRDANRQSAEFAERMTRTPGGPSAYPLAAPLRTFAWRDGAEGCRELVARTGIHGPVALLRVRHASGSLIAVEVAEMDPAAVARPDALEAVRSTMRAELERLAERDGWAGSDVAWVLERILQTAAILLLDPEVEDRLRRARGYAARERARKAASPYDMADFSYRAGSPGLGRRA